MVGQIIWGDVFALASPSEVDRLSLGCEQPSFPWDATKDHCSGPVRWPLGGLCHLCLETWETCFWDSRTLLNQSIQVARISLGFLMS